MKKECVPDTNMPEMRRYISAYWIKNYIMCVDGFIFIFSVRSVEG